jgi:HSP20 family protein
VAHVSEDRTKRDSSKHTDKDRPADKDKIVKRLASLGGILGGFGGLIEKLGELAEAGEGLSKSGEFQDSTGKVRGVYGINVRTALSDSGETELKVEPFGNVRRDSENTPKGEDVREPLLDVYEEDDHVLVLVELPGVAKENVHLKMTDGRLELSAERGKTTYRKKIDLPKNCTSDKMTWECGNGILQVRFSR